MPHVLNKIRDGAPGRLKGRTLRAATGPVTFDGLEARRLMANPSVTALTLIDAASDQPIGTLANGSSITVDLKNTPSINFRADVAAAASVRFGYDANTNFRTESAAPFAFAGDNGPGDYLSWTPAVGTHTVSARAFAGSNATSTASAECEVTLNVVNTGGVTQPTDPDPTPTPGQSPFLGSAPSLPSQTVLFDNFDNGGEGVAYHDTSTANETGQYRTNVGVDIENTTDAAPTGLQSQNGVGRNIGHIRAGEYLEYTVNVATAGTYNLQIRFASANAGGVVHLDVDGNNATGAINLNNTGGWQSWTTFQRSGVVLTAGTHVLKFVVDATNSGTDIGNLHWFRFVAAGGGGSTGGGIQTPGTLKWPTSFSRTNDAPSPRFEAMGHSFGGKLYVFGGFKDSQFRVDRTYAVYNPSTNQWTPLGTLPSGMAESHITPVDDGTHIYFVGGFKGDLRHPGGCNCPACCGATQDGSKLVYRWTPSTNAWSTLPSLPMPQGAAATAVVGRQIHMIGGNPSDRVTNIGDHFVLNLDNLGAGWQRKRAHPDPKDHASTIVLNDRIYVLGGEYGHDLLGDTQKSVHSYDPATDAWTRLADMPFRSGHAEGSTFAYNGYIYFAGGQTAGQVSTNRVAVYNPATNTWKEVSPLPNYLQGTQVAVFGNKVIVTLGARWTVQPLKETYVGYI